jgi:DNA-binding LytR/AlgR family response regulator
VEGKTAKEVGEAVISMLKNSPIPVLSLTFDNGTDLILRCTKATIHSLTMTCLVIEDEPLAAGILEDYIWQVPWLRFAGRCADALAAYEALKQQPVGAIFLDIHLPGLKGLDFLRSLPHPPQAILTTAYHEYALDGYELNVVDYLLKPIDFERFLRAVQKLKPSVAAPAAAPERAFHFFNVNKKMVRVWLDDILSAESLKEYVRLHLRDGSSLVTKGQLSDMEQRLAGRHFVRAHRSFLVGLRHVEAFTATELFVGGLTVPIGRQYQAEVQAALARL